MNLQEEALGSPERVLTEMERLREKLWVDISIPTAKEDATFPYVEFADMIRGMVSLDVGEGASMAEVVNHEFWQKFDPSKCVAYICIW